MAAIDATSGTPTSWNPAPDSAVHAIAVDWPNVYLGGGFSQVDGQQRAGIAAVNAGSGVPSAFNPGVAGGTVDAFAVVGSTLYV
ncbi:MAG: hypothetical protein ACRDKV_05240, partial [Solirubrobacterales bacterium]